MSTLPFKGENIISKYREPISWLLKGDPAVRYQTLRDLIGSGETALRKERGAIALSGWGKRLLSLQDTEGTWGGGWYSPKWTSTTYTLLLLKDLGIETHPKIEKACHMLLDAGFCGADGGINLSKGYFQSETCITGMLLGVFSFFGLDDKRLDRLAAHLLDRQMKDGGWNCQQPRGAVHGSFHTTINVLEGLGEYERRFGRSVRAVSSAQNRGLEFLLQHRLFQSSRTGKAVKSSLTQFSFPPRWYYDVLRALDYAQSRNSSRDNQFGDGIRLVESKQMKNGRWPLQNKHPGRVFFEIEKPGEASRWNTLRALRVLKWWNGWPAFRP